MNETSTYTTIEHERERPQSGSSPSTFHLAYPYNMQTNTWQQVRSGSEKRTSQKKPLIKFSIQISDMQPFQEVNFHLST
ncbi:hypothetical protein TNCT_530391 [Trichonephila clavata]|uniref:Uncharacterized protein n=1 Tax=Trichonephila clavata TaxID=2740835 RepID=A0A8X6F0C2_TRICU|nr:hypothetical protein TNCT_530391 [Trichonephila clavata]